MPGKVSGHRLAGSAGNGRRIAGSAAPCLSGAWPVRSHVAWDDQLAGFHFGSGHPDGTVAGRADEAAELARAAAWVAAGDGKLAAGSGRRETRGPGCCPLPPAVRPGACECRRHVPVAVAVHIGVVPARVTVGAGGLMALGAGLADVHAAESPLPLSSSTATRPWPPDVAQLKDHFRSGCPAAGLGQRRHSVLGE